MRTDAPPTPRQIYALAAALCEQAGEEFPGNRGAASELIERLRTELGHPAPRLEDHPRRPRASARGSSGRGTEKLARAIATEVLRELR
jgi:hypothetical protein